MNKYKKNLESLRRHLGRDTPGLVLLDDIAKDLSEQRKRLAGLEESEANAVARADRARKELDRAQLQVATQKEEIAKERVQRKAADLLARQQAEKVAAMEAVAAADYEDVQLSVGAGDITEQRLVHLYRDVSKRFRRMPPVHGQSLDIDDVIVNYTRDEFMSLGMLISFVSLFVGTSPRVICKARAKKLTLSDKALARMVYWLGPWMSDSPTNRKISDECFGPGNPRRAKRSREEAEE